MKYCTIFRIFISLCYHSIDVSTISSKFRNIITKISPVSRIGYFSSYSMRSIIIFPAIILSSWSTRDVTCCQSQFCMNCNIMKSLGNYEQSTSELIYNDLSMLRIIHTDCSWLSNVNSKDDLITRWKLDFFRQLETVITIPLLLPEEDLN